MGAVQLTACVEIPAPPHAVWEVLVDIDTWPHWCPPVRWARAHGGWVPGAEIAFSVDFGVPVSFQMTLTQTDKPAILAWHGRKWWGVEATRTWSLRPIDGGTRVEDHKRFVSRLPIDWVYPMGAIQRMSDAWLRGLATEVVRRAGQDLHGAATEGPLRPPFDDAQA